MRKFLFYYDYYYYCPKYGHLVKCSPSLESNYSKENSEVGHSIRIFL